MVNKLDYHHQAVSSDDTTKQEPKDELLEEMQPPAKKRKRMKCENSEEFSIEIFKYSCPLCNVPIKKKDLLDRHMFKHTGKVRKKFKGKIA